jgi:hypothetical protein
MLFSFRSILFRQSSVIVTSSVLPIHYYHSRIYAIMCNRSMYVSVQRQRITELCDQLSSVTSCTKEGNGYLPLPILNLISEYGLDYVPPLMIMCGFNGKLWSIHPLLAIDHAERIRFNHEHLPSSRTATAIKNAPSSSASPAIGVPSASASPLERSEDEEAKWHQLRAVNSLPEHLFHDLMSASLIPSSASALATATTRERKLSEEGRTRSGSDGSGTAGGGNRSRRNSTSDIWLHDNDEHMICSVGRGNSMRWPPLSNRLIRLSFQHPLQSSSVPAAHAGHHHPPSSTLPVSPVPTVRWWYREEDQLSIEANHRNDGAQSIQYVLNGSVPGGREIHVVGAEAHEIYQPSLTRPLPTPPPSATPLGNYGDESIRAGKEMIATPTINSQWLGLPYIDHVPYYSAMVRLGRMIIRCGGCYQTGLPYDTQSHASFLNQVDAFDTKTRKWTSLSPLNIGRSDAIAVVIHGCVWVLGGRAEGQIFAVDGTSFPGDTPTIEILSRTTRRWYMAPITLPHHHSSTHGTRLNRIVGAQVILDKWLVVIMDDGCWYRDITTIAASQSTSSTSPPTTSRPTSRPSTPAKTGLVSSTGNGNGEWHVFPSLPEDYGLRLIVVNT